MGVEVARRMVVAIRRPRILGGVVGVATPDMSANLLSAYLSFLLVGKPDNIVFDGLVVGGFLVGHF